MHLEYSRCVNCQRTVHVDGNRWNCAFTHQAVQSVDHFLGSTKRKRRDEYTAATCSSFANYLSQLCSRPINRFMVSVTVSRLHDKRIRAFGRGRVANYCQTTPPDVSRENEPLRPSILGTIE